MPVMRIFLPNVTQHDFGPERASGDFFPAVVNVRHILRRGVTVRGYKGSS